MRRALFVLACSFTLVAPAAVAQTSGSSPAWAPGSRVLLDAHNAYPEDGRFTDRMIRALSTGLPVAIEQDLVWYRDPATGQSRSIVSHGAPFTGREPSLDQYFFSTVRPLIEAAIRRNDRAAWPVLVLNLDFKTNEPEHLRAVWDLLGHYASWLCTAKRTGSVHDITPLTAGPLLVLTGEADEQERVFHDHVPLGQQLRLFGAVHTVAGSSPDVQTNYRRWWNNPWSVVEGEGQPKAGAWTDEEAARLDSLVRTAHQQNLWIRFYTLDGYDPGDTSKGWSAGYNFGSITAAQSRWAAAIRAGVDFIATNQYEDFKQLQNSVPVAAVRTSPSLLLTGTLARGDYESLIERNFDVPAGVDRIDVELSYDEAERTVVDLGLRGPASFRGWSGGGSQRIHVGAHSASFGYTPGAIEPGQWAVVLGVPNIRPGVAAPYKLRITMDDQTRGPALKDTAGWYAGDLHSHSGHSDGRTPGDDGVRHPVPPEHVFNAAARAGLDFVALTDHNTASHWAEVDRLQPLFPTLLLLHGREVTTYKGHLNAFGERHFVDFRLGPGRDVPQLVDSLNGGGAFLSINHPLLPDDESCMGCGWNDRSDDVMRQVQGVEIVNGDRIDGDQAGWQFWADMLNRGYRLTAIGGSDEHTPDELVDRALGRPTTVVYANALSEQAILQGIRAGHASVRTRGPDGPALEFAAIAGGERYVMGSVLPPVSGAIVLEARIERAGNQTIVWIRNGLEVSRASIQTGEGGSHSGTAARFEIAAAPGDWFSVVLRDEAGPTLFSNAVYIAR